MYTEYKLFHSANSCNYGVNMVAPRYSAARERMKSFIEKLCQEVKREGFCLDKDGQYEKLLRDWADAQSLALEEFEEKKGVWFLISETEVTLVAVGVR